MSKGLLEIREATVSYGDFRAVDDVSITVPTGSITGLIGPNGAGKSSLFSAIAGETKLSGGSIIFDGTPIHGLKPNRIFASGLARTFQIPRPFAGMSVLENLLLASPHQLGETFWRPVVQPGRVHREDSMLLEKAREILDFTNLESVSGEAAGNLSGGQQKLLELARILMGDPRLILLDEPAAGVNPSLMQILIDRVLALNARGITFLIIEHNMDLVMRHCAPIVALAQGRVVFSGSADEAARDPILLDAYLGAPTLG